MAVQAGGNKVTGEKFTFFFTADAVFSQWHRAEFLVDGQVYNCAEQYMMHQKGMSLMMILELF